MINFGDLFNRHGGEEVTRESVLRSRISLCETKLHMFYVYLLKSLKNNDLYVGYCSDLKIRFKRHNDGKVKSTKTNIPWELVYYEAYKDKQDATKREKQLKNHATKESLNEQIKYSIGAVAKW